MTTPDRLAMLARMQALREHRERVRAEDARLELTAKEHEHRLRRAEEEAMQDAVLAESRQASLCVDRWRMLAGQLNLNAERTGAAWAQLASAKQDFDRARDQLKCEIMRTQNLEVRFRKAARKFAAKKDEAALQNVRSLHAGTKGSAPR